MSLEDEIKKLTTAIVDLTEALTYDRATPPAADKAPAAPKAAAAKAPKAEKPEPEAKPEEPKADAKPAAAAKPKASADAYAPVKKAILDAIAGGHRKSITDMLAEYDAKTGQDLSPDVYPEVLEKIAVIVGGELEGDLA